MQGLGKIQSIPGLQPLTNQDDVETTGLRTARCKRIAGVLKADRFVS